MLFSSFWRNLAHVIPLRAMDRRISGPWSSSIGSYPTPSPQPPVPDSQLPEPEWNIAWRKSNSQAHAVGPLVVVLETAALVLVHVQGQDSVGESGDLPAQTQIGV